MTESAAARAALVETLTGALAQCDRAGRLVAGAHIASAIEALADDGPDDDPPPSDPADFP